jgi:hypothetical protein
MISSGAVRNLGSFTRQFESSDPKMRSFCIAAALMVITLAAGKTAAQSLELSSPTDALAALRKIQCSTKDSTPVVYHWSGHVFSRVPGEPDRHLFDVEGMNIRQCVTVNDPKRGVGFRMVSRELMFYLDPQTGTVLETWLNPFTGKTVDVVPVVNDPVNMRPMFAVDDHGKPFTLGARVEGGRVFATTEVPLFYRNPLGGDYQDYVGNQYHAMEIFDFVVDKADLLNKDRSEASPSVAWVRVAEWLPWMEMGGRSGLMVMNATGQKVAGIDQLPAVLREKIHTRYPAWTAAPPVDDQRPNETSWTYFKKMLAARKAAAPAP